ncbi:hypothetical protein CEXT_804621 [Caerostris extrusa]|uniref:Uncharacterized protein n=1 Tax=Caerostris extrusa TaxID=172846 RepID=A0AAV4UCA4_CAEEX|nr:hypothetical protein CEXT_804621 [Caerostris extrusa]
MNCSRPGHLYSENYANQTSCTPLSQQIITKGLAKTTYMTENCVEQWKPISKLPSNSGEKLFNQLMKK